MVEVLKKKVSMTFAETVEHVKAKMEEEGFTILLVKSITESIRNKLGIADFEECTMILGCNPEIAYKVLMIDKAILSLFPCSFVVYEDNGDVIVSHVSIMKIAKVLEIVKDEGINEIIEMTSRATKAIWATLN